MVNYYIYARDCSFSTFNNEHYHTNGLKTLEQFKRDVENIKEEQSISNEPPKESRIVYLHWGDDCWEVDEDEARSSYLEMYCEQMGTHPECIIKCIQQKYIFDDNDKIKLLYLITDGLISQESAKKCSRMNEFMNYETTVFHAFNEDKDKIDISVAASFFKNRCMVYRNYKLYASIDISKEYGYDKINLHNFAFKKNELKSYIMLKFINGDEDNAVVLREFHNLKRLQDRLLNESLLKPVINEKVNIQTLEKDLNNSVPTTILEMEIHKSISALVNYIYDDSKCYSFDALTFNTEYDEFVEVKHLDDFDLPAEQELEIFDFILEEDAVVPIVNRILVDAT